MTWGVTFIGQRGQFEIGLKGSLCVGISRCLFRGGECNDYVQVFREAETGTSVGEEYLEVLSRGENRDSR